MTKTILILTILVTTSFSLSACGNTFEGAGRDMEKAGKWVQNTF